MMLGLLLYLSVFAALAEIQANLSIALTVLGFGTLAGIALLVVNYSHEPRRAIVVAIIATAIALIGVVVRLIPVNFGAADPYNYAFAAATLFDNAWLSQNAARLPNPEGLATLLSLVRVSRAPVVALVWPSAGLQFGVTLADIFAVGFLLLALTFIVIFDTLRGLLDVPSRVLVAAGSVGAANLASVLLGGQINQPFALFTLACMLWLARNVGNNLLYVSSLVLSSYVITAGYPEMLIALPLYGAGASMLHGASWRALLLTACGLFVGFVLAQLLTGMGSLAYVFNQSTAIPGWQPLAHTPTSLLEVWSQILAGPWLARTALVIIAPLLALVWLRPGQRSLVRVPRPIALSMLGAFAIFAVILTVTLTHSPNPNYATFKLAGWLGPAILVDACLISGAVQGRAQWGALALALSLATVRVAMLPFELNIDIRSVAAVPNPGIAWHFTDPDESGACVVQPTSAGDVFLFQAIAESAAPTRDCRIAVAP
jgi:hypothetical protein